MSLVPLALVFRRARRGAAGLAGAAFGVTFFGLLFPWIHLFGLAAYLLLVGLEAAFVAAFLALGTVLRDTLPARGRFLAFPGAMLAGEFARSGFPLGGFPWGGLGYSQHNDHLVLPLAAYAGVWGISLLIALVNAVLAEAAAGVRQAPRRAGAALACAALLAVAPAALPVPTPGGRRATLALVQGNAPQQDPAHPHALDQEALDNQVRETGGLQGRHVDLVVWPESSLGHDPFTDPDLLAPLQATVQQVGAPFLVGATIGVPATPGADAGAPRFRNESLFFSAGGALLGRYVKRHLVPFGEYVPARRELASWITELKRVPADAIPGRTATVFALAQGKFGSVICYETAYPESVRSLVAKGARMIVVSTDNSSYLRTDASAQMVAMSQLRAAEERVWVAQAALTGISAVIAPDGAVVRRTGLFEPALLTPTVRFATGTTPYARFGDWLPVLCLLGIVGGLAAGVLGAVRHRGAP